MTFISKLLFSRFSVPYGGKNVIEHDIPTNKIITKN